MYILKLAGLKNSCLKKSAAIVLKLTKPWVSKIPLKPKGNGLWLDRLQTQADTGLSLDPIELDARCLQNVILVFGVRQAKLKTFCLFFNFGA